MKTVQEEVADIGRTLNNGTGGADHERGSSPDDGPRRDPSMGYWSEPAQVIGTGGDGDPGILRIRFPDYGDDENLSAISWEQFFRKFEDERLCFTYQETLKDGQESRFSKLTTRDG